MTSKLQIIRNRVTPLMARAGMENVPETEPADVRLALVNTFSSKSLKSPSWLKSM